ncbi:hypothetical protein MRX96_010815 [Rhipicephalus microplus]
MDVSFPSVSSPLLATWRRLEDANEKLDILNSGDGCFGVWIAGYRRFDCHRGDSLFRLDSVLCLLDWINAVVDSGIAKRESDWVSNRGPETTAHGAVFPPNTFERASTRTRVIAAETATCAGGLRRRLAECRLSSSGVARAPSLRAPEQPWRQINSADPGPPPLLVAPCAASRPLSLLLIDLVLPAAGVYSTSAIVCSRTPCCCRDGYAACKVAFWNCTAWLDRSTVKHPAAYAGGIPAMHLVSCICFVHCLGYVL